MHSSWFDLQKTPFKTHLLLLCWALSSFNGVLEIRFPVINGGLFCLFCTLCAERAVIGCFHKCTQNNLCRALGTPNEINWNDDSRGVSKHLLDLLCRSCHFRSRICASKHFGIGLWHYCVCVCMCVCTCVTDNRTVIEEPLGGSASTKSGSLQKCMWN